MKKLPVRFINQFWILIILLLASCTHGDYKNDPQLSDALKAAGDNRSELEKVLSHYSDPEDSLKYKAAVFLIKFMQGRYARVFPNYDSYKPVFDSIVALNEHNEQVARTPEFYKYYKISVVTNFFPQNLLVNRRDSSSFETKEDLNTITTDYLIENIDYAFKAWQMPWARHLTFEEFCEYILPYRYGNEELKPWRKEYFESSIHFLDPVKNINDPVKVGMFLNRIGEESFSEVPQLGELTNAIRPLDLIRINTSTSCADQTGLALLRMRGLGIPVTKLSTPLWGNRDSGHDFNAILNLDKKWIGFQNQELGSGIYKIPPIFEASKIYAETYSPNPNSTYVSDQSGDFVIKPAYVDVTKDVVDVTEITVPFESSKNGEMAGLCIFNNEEWIPVVRASVQNGKAVFPQLGKRIMYMAGIINNGAIELKGDPFLLDSAGLVKPIRPAASKQMLILDRKFPHTPWIVDKYPALIGGIFQGSNDSAFAKTTDLWKIDRLTSMHSLKKELKNAAYQYVRFVFPGIARINESLAGIQFYGQNGDMLQGEPMSSSPASKAFYSNVFDNNNLSYVKLLNENYADFPQFPEGDNLVIPDKTPFWVGLKYKTRMNISSLEISPRTDDNGVNKGEPYELLYWDKGEWHSLGTKTATENKIRFTGPKNALYLLKNAEKGREHRIFLYQDNKQVWF